MRIMSRKFGIAAVTAIAVAAASIALPSAASARWGGGWHGGGWHGGGWHGAGWHGGGWHGGGWGWGGLGLGLATGALLAAATAPYYGGYYGYGVYPCGQKIENAERTGICASLIGLARSGPLRFCNK